MAAAMAVEMGFLGLTFAAACTGQPKGKVRPARPGALDSSSGAAGAWAGRHAHAKIPVCVRAQPALPRSDAPMHAGAQALLAVIAGPFFLMLGSALGGLHCPLPHSARACPGRLHGVRRGRRCCTW